MEQKIKNLILENSVALFGENISESMIQFQPTRKDVEGDLTLVVFPFVKLLRCKPEDAGQLPCIFGFTPQKLYKRKYNKG